MSAHLPGTLAPRLLGNNAAPPRPPGRCDAVALAKLVPPVDHWRLFGDLEGSARFLDIETVGLQLTDPITLVGISDGYFSTVLVRGRDLNRERLWEALAGARLLVTFNGAAFDLPRLRRAFPGLPAWDLPHFDLAILGRRVGLRGGLKAVERALGRERPPELEAVDGAEAVRLWEAYQAGDRAALTQLTHYCRADTEALQALAPRIYQRLLAQAGEVGVGWLPPLWGTRRAQASGSPSAPPSAIAASSVGASAANSSPAARASAHA